MQRCDYCFQLTVDETSRICGHCGSVVGTERPFGPTRMLSVRPSTFNLVLRNQHQGILKKNEIALYFHDLKEPVIALLEDQLVFGRFAKDVIADYPAFDLTPFQAVERGISRAHAVLQRYNQEVFVKDLGSTNGTWVNANRIPPRALVKVENGDRVVFARLSIYIYFE